MIVTNYAYSFFDKIYCHTAKVIHHLFTFSIAHFRNHASASFSRSTSRPIE